MSTATESNRDLAEAVTLLISGGGRDPALAQKAREDLDRMREETRQRIGTVEVAVDLIRDARDP